MAQPKLPNLTKDPRIKELQRATVPFIGRKGIRLVVRLLDDNPETWKRPWRPKLTIKDVRRLHEALAALKG